ncbi:MAG: metalloregulator ArsR/SmtB family transcription factor [Bacillota bacterium]
MSTSLSGVAPSPHLHSLLRVFKALADESRLKILGILAGGRRNVEELAAMLDLRAPTVSHHLAVLRRAELVGMRPEGTSHVYFLEAETLQRLSREFFSPEAVVSLSPQIEGDAWERKVLRDLFANGRLKEIPASRKKRDVILRWLAGRFTPGVRYREAEVNEIIKRYHPDFATLRRELIMSRLMQRERGLYWRTEPPAPAATGPGVS